MKITLCGLPGTGKGTLGNALASKHGLEFTSAGDIFRSWAKEEGMALNDFETKAKADPQFDNKLDDKVAEYGKSQDNFIFDGRLAWHFIPDSLKIKLICGLEERIRRVASREKIFYDDALIASLERDQIIAGRYKKFYGIDDYLSNANFDVVIDTTHLNVEEGVAEIEKYLTEKGHLN
jgi:cytidylate kinase